MSSDNLLFTKNHEWLENKTDGSAKAGITEYAAQELGDIVYVELPDVGDEFDAGEAFGNVESVKAVSPLNMPVSGKIIEVNEELEDSPELVNQSAVEQGWMVKVEVKDEYQLKDLMDFPAYQEFLKSQA